MSLRARTRLIIRDVSAAQVTTWSDKKPRDFSRGSTAPGRVAKPYGRIKKKNHRFLLSSSSRRPEPIHIHIYTRPHTHAPRRTQHDSPSARYTTTTTTTVMAMVIIITIKPLAHTICRPRQPHAYGR